MDEQKTDSIGVTTIAIREVLMEYFKETCIQRMTKGGNVNLHELSTNRRGLNREERWRMSFKRPCLLLLDEVPLATLGKDPDTLIIHSDVMNRSPQLKKVQTGMEKFMKTFLSEVKLRYRKGGVFYG